MAPMGPPMGPPPGGPPPGMMPGNDKKNTYGEIVKARLDELLKEHPELRMPKPDFARVGQAFGQMPGGPGPREMPGPGPERMPKKGHKPMPMPGQEHGAMAMDFFDLDIDNNPVDGFVAIIGNKLVIDKKKRNPVKKGLFKKKAKALKSFETKAIPVSEIKEVSLRQDFGVVSFEIEKTDGTYEPLFHATTANGKRLLSIVKSIENMLAAAGEPSQHEGPRHRKPREQMFCPKCGRPLRPGAKSCDKCFDKFKIIKELLKLVKPHTVGIIFVIIIFFINMGLGLISPYINKVLVDDYITNAEAGELAASEPMKVLIPFAITTSTLLILHILTWAVSFGRSMISMHIGIGTVVDLRKTLYDKIQKMSISKVESNTTGELLRRLTGDAQSIQGFVNNWFPDFFQQIIELIVVAIIMFFYDWKLLLIFLLPLPITLFVVKLFQKKSMTLMERQRQTAGRTDSSLHDILSGIRVVKAYGTEKKENARYDNDAATERDITIDTDIHLAKLQPFISFGLSVGSYFLLYYTGSKILGNELTIGECSMFTSYCSMIYGPLNWLANFPSQLARLLTSANRIFETLESEEEMAVENGVVKKIEGNIAFENVSFGYDQTQVVLKDINLEIHPGEMIGLVGRSGVGKSTLTNLVMRLYDVDNGRITIDGIDIRDYNPECYRGQLGAVLQETILKSGSLYDNLVYSKPDATIDEVIACSKAAGVHDFAVKLPDGYNTRIGEKGYTLSGGERQRVAIARAILRNPRILILDEATASLDTEMEKQIQDAIEILIKDRTTIAIAHRLSTLRNATKIVVIDEGHIAEVGSHEELMKKKGMYYELVLAQRM